MMYLRTIHGSRLYNLHRPDSDYDYYIVEDERRRARLRDARQTIKGDTDTTRVGITTFLMLCDKGVPQAIEAMFSPVAEVDERFTAYRAGYRPNISNCYHTFRKTAMSIAGGNDKQRRHALRILYNLTILIERGRFNPRLDRAVVAMLDYAAKHNFEDNLQRMFDLTEF